MAKSKHTGKKHTNDTTIIILTANIWILTLYHTVLKT